jgi:ABC-2 type transport system permease protein
MTLILARLLALTKKEFLLVMRDGKVLVALFVLPAIFILIMSLALPDGQAALLTYKFSGEKSQADEQLAALLTATGQIREAKSGEKAQFIIGNGGLPDGPIAVTVDYRVEAQSLSLFRAQMDLALLRQKLAVFQKGPVIPGLDGGAGAVTYAWNGARAARPSPTQQSVPSWIIFAMFFVVIPLAGVFVAERRQGTLARLRGMDVGFPLILAGKILPYFLINQLQTALMLLTGLYLTPMCGGQALVITGSPSGLALISAAVSFSAIGAALFIATLATTAEQASTIGGIINVLFGAIGGVMVPKFLMPDFMQDLAMLSPMSWGLDGFLKIFVKGEGVRAVAGESAMLFLFGIIAMALAAAARKRG